MLAKNTHALIFYSDTKLTNLLAKINFTKYGNDFHMDHTCSPHLKYFLNEFFDTFNAVHEAAHRLFVFQGATYLIECDTYLSMFYYFESRRESTLVCPHYYAASLDECKQWANNQCQVFSQFEKLWLKQHQTARRFQEPPISTTPKCMGTPCRPRRNSEILL